MPRPNEPDPSKLREPDMPRAFEDHLRRQRGRIRFVRVALVILAILTMGSAGLAFFAQNETIDPQRIHVALGPDDRAVVVTHGHDIMHLTTRHELYFLRGEEQVVSPNPFKGVSNGAGFLSDGRVAVFFNSLANVFPKPDKPEQWPGESEALHYYEIPTRHGAFCAANDGVLVAWVMDGKLHYRMAGDGETTSEPAPLEGVEKKVKLFDVAWAGDHAVAALLTESDQLHLLKFAFAREKASEEAVSAPAENVLPPAPAGKPEVQPPAESAPAPERFVYRISNLSMRTIEGSVTSFSLTSFGNRALVAWRPQSVNEWLASVDHGGEWSADFKLGALMPAPTETIPYLRPLIALDGDRLVNFDVDREQRAITRRAVSVPVAGEVKWETLQPWVLIGVNLPVDADLLTKLFLIFMSGTVLCMVWLGLNREQDIDRALNVMIRAHTGRDTKKLSVSAALAPSDKLMWAGPIRRALAFMADVVVLFPFLYLIIDAKKLDIENINLWAQPTENLLQGLMERLILLLVFAVYGFFCEVRWGRTLGKMLLGMRVVTPDGKRPGLVAVFMRNLLRVIEFAHPFVIMISTFSILLTRRNQRIGDVLSGTAVKITMDEDEDDDDTTLRQPSGK